MYHEHRVNVTQQNISNKLINCKTSLSNACMKVPDTMEQLVIGDRNYLHEDCRGCAMTIYFNAHLLKPPALYTRITKSYIICNNTYILAHLSTEIR